MPAPRVPLLMFGGRVRPGIERRWISHVSIGRTVLDLLGLPPLGVLSWTRRRVWPTWSSRPRSTRRPPRSAA